MKFVTSARRIAEQTPDSRNRYVDFLRAFSILVVVLGHWLMAAPEVIDGEIRIGHLLSDVEWTRWSTWVFQVMPIFFFVGGYANAVAWRSARTRAVPYGTWLRDRLRRLVVPVLPVLAVWTVVAFLALRWGLDPWLVKVGSMAALVPVWFLATYVVIVTLAPVTLRLWERFGWGLFFGLAALAAVVDILSLGLDNDAIGYLNYLFVWNAVHVLGYAWADDRLAAGARRMWYAAAGLAALAALVYFGPYPVAMVGIDNSPITNSNPPKITNIALGLFQFGLAMTAEAPARAWLRRIRVWTPVVAINGMIMTIYLWHLTAMVAVIGGLLAIDGFGLGIEGNTPRWWLTRPIWLATMTLVTLPLLAFFVRFERTRKDQRPAPPPWRPVLAVIGLCTGLGLLAKFGITNETELRLIPLLLPFVGIIAGGVVSPRPFPRPTS